MSLKPFLKQFVLKENDANKYTQSMSVWQKIREKVAIELHFYSFSEQIAEWVCISFKANANVTIITEVHFNDIFVYLLSKRCSILSFFFRCCAFLKTILLFIFFCKGHLLKRFYLE